MLSRLLLTLFVLWVSALGGYWLGGMKGILWATNAALLGLLVRDYFSAHKLVVWLRKGEPLAVIEMDGFWGELVDRVRRGFKNRSQLAEQHQNRLKDFLSAIQASPNGVLLLDEEGRIEWCNQTAAVHLGLDDKRDVGQHIVNLVRDPLFTRYVAQGDYQKEVVIEGRTNSLTQQLNLQVQLHPYGDNKKLVLTRDDTARAKADQMRRDFVANVSHEIRTPLTVLAGFVETLQSLPLKRDERKKYLDLMAVQATRMQGLVSDLLTLSQLEGSPPPPASEAVDLKPLMAQVKSDAIALSALHGTDGQAMHTFHFDWPERLHIGGSRAEIHSAVSNLVNNAVRYTPAHGVIDVLWKIGPEGQALFSVRDNGVGIAAEHLPRLSERFYRVDRSRSRESGGTGLGLAITKHIVQRHGGSFQVESEVGVGSCFSLLFPPSRVKWGSPETDETPEWTEITA
jgi:two-component system phosphate regulon sensor histidine kinase PhoR